jgi:hypothetical protein
MARTGDRVSDELRRARSRLTGSFLHSIRRWNAQILANLSRQVFVHLGVAGDGGAFVLSGISPPTVPSTFAEEVTSLLLKMAQKLFPLHIAIVTSV